MNAEPVPDANDTPNAKKTSATKKDIKLELRLCKLNLGQKLSQSQQAVGHYASDFVVFSKLCNAEMFEIYGWFTTACSKKSAAPLREMFLLALISASAL